MGHHVRHYEYEQNVDKLAVETKINAASYEEGGHGLDSPIRWFNHICESRKEAEEYIATHDEGWYDSLAVMFRKPKEEPAALRELRKRHGELARKLHEEDRKVAAKEFKSQYISCKTCGSKLNRDYIRSNFCPLCHNDMRSTTTLSKLASMRKQLEVLERKVEEAERKATTQGTICWLVKIEFHT